MFLYRKNAWEMLVERNWNPVENTTAESWYFCWIMRSHKNESLSLIVMKDLPIETIA